MSITLEQLKKVSEPLIMREKALKSREIERRLEKVKGDKSRLRRLSRAIDEAREQGDYKRVGAAWKDWKMEIQLQMEEIIEAVKKQSGLDAESLPHRQELSQREISQLEYEKSQLNERLIYSAHERLRLEGVIENLTTYVDVTPHKIAQDLGLQDSTKTCARLRYHLRNFRRRGLIRSSTAGQNYRLESNEYQKVLSLLQSYLRQPST